MKKFEIILTKKSNKPALWTGRYTNTSIAVLDHCGNPKRPIFLGRNDRVLIPLHTGDYIMTYDLTSDSITTYQIRNFTDNNAICRIVSEDAPVPEFAEEIMEEMRQEDFIPPHNKSTDWYRYVANNTYTR